MIRFNSFLLFFIILLGCSHEKVSLRDRIPTDALVVGKVNSQQFLKENALNLFSMMDWSEIGDESSIVNAGIDPFSNAYFYITGTGFQDLQLNFLTKLSDHNAFEDWLKQEKHEVQGGEIKFSFLGPNIGVSFDEEVAMWSLTLALPVVKEVCLRAFMRDERTSERIKEIEMGLESSSHLSIWFDSQKLSEIYKAAQQILPLLGLEIPIVPYEPSSQSDLLEMNFNSGQVLVKNTRFFSDEEFMTYKALHQNHLSPLTRSENYDESILNLNLRLDPHQLIQRCSSNPAVEGMIDQQLSGYLRLSELDSIIDGRIHFEFYGMQEKLIDVYQSALNESTGEYNALKRQARKSIPTGVLIVGLKSKRPLEQKFAFLMQHLEKAGDWFLLEPELEVKLEDQRLIVASGEKAINHMKKDPVPNSAGTTNSDKRSINFRMSAGQVCGEAKAYVKGLSPIFEVLGGVLSDIYMDDLDVQDSRVTETYRIQFQSQENSLMQLKKILERMKQLYHF